MDAERLAQILKAHDDWLQGKGGKRADLSHTNLRGADLRAATLSDADLGDANLRGTNLRSADLCGANLYGANLYGANLCGANLSAADLSDADLGDANLRNTDLSSADLSSANLSDADLRSANLRDTNLSRADLSNTNLCGADLSRAKLRDANLSRAKLRAANLSAANLSGCTGLLDPSRWLKDNLERHREGYVCYKSFPNTYRSPTCWSIQRGAEIAEVVNPLPTLDCACGVNVARAGWAGLRRYPREEGVWRCLIKWEWLPSVVVPYNTDGKFRCGRVKLLGKVKEGGNDADQRTE